MKKQSVTVRCENGLHMRVAAGVVNLVSKHAAAVHLACGDCKKANACSILELITLGVEKGAKIEITAEGRDEEIVTEQLSQMFEQGDGI